MQGSASGRRAEHARKSRQAEAFGGLVEAFDADGAYHLREQELPSPVSSVAEGPAVDASGRLARKTLERARLRMQRLAAANVASVM